jgi:hypothetical protein
LPFAGLRLPACDSGAPYFWRFSAVSGIGPLVVTVVVTLALVPETSAEVVVLVLVTPEVVVVAEVSPAAPVAAPEGVPVAAPAVGGLTWAPAPVELDEGDVWLGLAPVLGEALEPACA